VPNFSHVHIFFHVFPKSPACLLICGPENYIGSAFQFGELVQFSPTWRFANKQEFDLGSCATPVAIAFRGALQWVRRVPTITRALRQLFVTAVQF
jgi:hypothetical protein